MVYTSLFSISTIFQLLFINFDKNNKFKKVKSSFYFNLKSSLTNIYTATSGLVSFFNTFRLASVILHQVKSIEISCEHPFDFTINFIQVYRVFSYVTIICKICPCPSLLVYKQYKFCDLNYLTIL
jgi:hypothetical protein